MHIDFLSIGELLADMITKEHAEDLSHATSFDMFQGGSPANVAANLQFLGKKAAVVSCVGNDGIGKFLIQELKKTGISDQYIQISQTHPTSIILVTRNYGTPDFLAYRMADAQLQTPGESVIKTARIIHTTAFALSMQPARDVIIHALEISRGDNKIISVDWNFSPAIWKTDNGKEIFERIMQMKPLVKLSSDDMERFTGKSKNIEEYKSYLDKYDCTLICLTNGKDGVWFKEGSKKWAFKPVIAVKEVIDSTGAGDAFWSGFISSFIDHLTIDECIDNALKVASIKIQKKGPLYNI